MSILHFDQFRDLTTLLAIAASLLAGFAIGLLYFLGIWWQARLFAARGGGLIMIALILGRFAILAGALTLASMQGALPLLMAALGVFIARPVVMRRVRETQA